jgi:hypothetical protein
MKELKWVEKITDKVWISLLVWIGLVIISRGLDYILSEGNIIQATLELVGLFVFLTSLWKHWQKRKGTDNKAKQNSSTLILLALIGLMIVGFTIKYYVSETEKNTNRKFESCMLECLDANMTRTQESICENNCIEKYK